MVTELEQVKRACCRVVSRGDGRFVSTGFLVAPDRVLTCGHGLGRASAVACRFDAGRAIEAEVEWHDATDDVALLRLASPAADLAPLSLDTTRPAVEAALTLYGFPIGAAEDGLTVRATVRDPSAGDPPKLQLYSDDLSSGFGPRAEGLSGGPVVAGRRVVGQVQRCVREELPELGPIARPAFGTLYATPADRFAARLGTVRAPGPELRAAFFASWGFDDPDAADLAVCDLHAPDLAEVAARIPSALDAVAFKRLHDDAAATDDPLASDETAHAFADGLEAVPFTIYLAHARRVAVVGRDPAWVFEWLLGELLVDRLRRKHRELVSIALAPRDEGRSGGLRRALARGVALIAEQDGRRIATPHVTAPLPALTHVTDFFCRVLLGEPTPLANRIIRQFGGRIRLVHDVPAGRRRGHRRPRAAERDADVRIPMSPLPFHRLGLPLLARCLGWTEAELAAYATGEGARYGALDLPKQGHGRRGESRRVYRVLDPALSARQRYVADSIIAAHAFPASVQGFLPKRSIVGNARAHLAAPVVAHADVAAFFESISRAAVEEAFRALGASAPVAAALAGLCTCEGSLPPGAPSSPVIANLVCADLDEDFGALAAEVGLTYTRYADDLAFSGATAPDAERVRAILNVHGFRLRRDGLRVQRKGNAQFVTGLSIAEPDAPRLPKAWKRSLRSALRLAVRRGATPRRKERLAGALRFASGVERNAPWLARLWAAWERIGPPVK